MTNRFSTAEQLDSAFSIQSSIDLMEDAIGATKKDLKLLKPKIYPNITQLYPDAVPTSVNSTALHEPSEDLHERISFVCEQARDEHFEDGMDSLFTKHLLSLIEQYGDETIEVIGNLIHSGVLDGEIAYEALILIGQLSEIETARIRRWVLISNLFSNSHWIRDGAIVGLSYLGDTKTIPHIQRALHQETVPYLKKFMIQVLEELKA